MSRISSVRIGAARTPRSCSREDRQQQNRCVSYRYDDDGSLILNCRVPAEAGARIVKALELAVEELPAALPDDVPAGTSSEPVPFSTRRADALALIAESFLAHGVMEAAGGDRQQIVVHVAAETLRDRTAGCCEFEPGPSMAAETGRRLACDASVVDLIENDDGEPLNVGRKTRTISAPLRRILNARDKGCRFPGCANTRYLDAHHVEHWANGGETKPSNLVSLCRFHHHAVHEGGIRIEILDDGGLRFVKPDGVASRQRFARLHKAARRLEAANSCNAQRRDRLERRKDGLRPRRRSAVAAGKAGEERSSGNACGGVRASSLERPWSWPTSPASRTPSPETCPCL